MLNEHSKLHTYRLFKNDHQQFEDTKGVIRIRKSKNKNRDEIKCCGRISSSYSTSDTRLVNLVTNPVTSHE